MGLTDLPKDVQKEIVKCLDKRDAKKLKVVCNKLKKIVDEVEKDQKRKHKKWVEAWTKKAELVAKKNTSDDWDDWEEQDWRE